MKATFNSLDIAVAVLESQTLVGMRVNQVYDVDHKTYLIKLHRGDEKKVLLIQSGIRFHTSVFEWPKSSAPSGFTMKLRKHLKNKRIASIQQLGKDRIVDFVFGSGEAAYHVILELFNRGNILLTDHVLTILNVLRPHVQGDKFKFSVKEVYPIARIRENVEIPNVDRLVEVFKNAEKGQKISKILVPHLDHGLALIDHCLLSAGFELNCKYNGVLEMAQLDMLAKSLLIGDNIINEILTTPTKGFIIKKLEPRKLQEHLITYIEFHPYLFAQHSVEQFDEYPSFNTAVDEYFSKFEGQKIELKALQMEKEALRKVEKIKDNQKQRLESLVSRQDKDGTKGEIIMVNSALVDEVICTVRKAISNQMSWPDINAFVNELKHRSHPVGLAVSGLKLEINHVTVSLSDPYPDSDAQAQLRSNLEIDVDLALSAHANATRYFSDKKVAAMKEKKTLEAQNMALKAAEIKARQTLKDIQTITTITKARRAFWFEKFFWFISSDNYLVIGGRDQQQNELIVKRYMRKGDLYVHADLRGASSVVIKNPTGEAVPPRTLNEAGSMAVCYSCGWEAKVLCSAWWVHDDQVSKTAPTGEYLTTGSFMIRGQKNYLLPAQLAMGFGFLFRIDESSVFRHKDERKAKTVDSSVDDEAKIEPEIEAVNIEERSTLTEHEVPVLEESENKDDNCDSDNEEFLSESFPNTQINICEILGTNGNGNALNLPKSQKDFEFHSVGTAHETKQQSKDVDNLNANKNSLKRGQRGRLKKIKQKYKDQDDEEKKLRMSILQSDGAKKNPKKLKKSKMLSSTNESRKVVQTVPHVVALTTKEPADHTTNEVDDEDVVVEIVNTLDCLTGQPFTQDELLFAIPVVAPYPAIINYKFKVKIVPGTGKRGKCARHAVEHFTRLRECSAQEKVLLRNVNDQSLSRNFPGKVKLNLAATKK